mgnify:CR=1 FL=1
MRLQAPFSGGLREQRKVFLLFRQGIPSFITPINHTIDTGKKIDARNIDKSDYCINEISPINIANLAKNILNSELLNG